MDQPLRRADLLVWGEFGPRKLTEEELKLFFGDIPEGYDKRISLVLNYCGYVIEHGGEFRDQPDSIETLVAELDRQLNTGVFGGLVQLYVAGEPQDGGRSE